MKSFVFDTNLSVIVSSDHTAQTNKRQDDLTHNNKLLIKSQINTLPGDFYCCKEREKYYHVARDCSIFSLMSKSARWKLSRSNKEKQANVRWWRTLRSSHCFVSDPFYFWSYLFLSCLQTWAALHTSLQVLLSYSHEGHLELGASRMCKKCTRLWILYKQL